MATVKKIEGKKGVSYKITVSCGYNSVGKQIREHKVWKPEPKMTARQIEKALERQKVLFEEQVRAGTQKDGNMRFEVFSEYWLSEYAEKKLKAKTVDGYKKRLKRIYPAIGHIKLKDLRHARIFCVIVNFPKTRKQHEYTDLFTKSEVGNRPC